MHIHAALTDLNVVYIFLSSHLFMSNVNTIMDFPSLSRVWVYCCSALVCCFSDLEKSGFSYFGVCLFCFHENIEFKKKGCFDMFLIKSADTALQNVLQVFYLTAIGCRIFYTGPLNFAFTPPLLVSCVVFTQRFQKSTSGNMPTELVMHSLHP